MFDYDVDSVELLLMVCADMPFPLVDLVYKRRGSDGLSVSSSSATDAAPVTSSSA